MREIKFRGKGICSNQFIYGDLLQIKESYYIINYDFEEHHDPNDFELWNIATQIRPETVGQFTGLKDKNGVEIYEGDIIKYHGRKCEYIYKGCCFGFWGDKRGFGEFITQSTDVEVIGNIHDND